MKRLLTAAFASVVLAGSITASASAQQGYRQQPQYESQRHDNRSDRNDRRDDRGWNDNRRDDHRWQRGDRIDNHRRYAEIDYRRANLRAPQRGYHYVRDDRGDILLAAIATGLIVSVIASH
jgi:Ni/Co efflux regulator RcnB